MEKGYDNMTWQEVLKLNLSTLEVGAATEYGGQEMTDWKNKIESLVPKMPADIRAGYDKAMAWVQSQM
jgi:hypothetical protein